MSFIAYILEFKTNKYSINNMYINLPLFFQFLSNIWACKTFVGQFNSSCLMFRPVGSRWQQRGHEGSVWITLFPQWQNNWCTVVVPVSSLNPLNVAVPVFAPGLSESVLFMNELLKQEKKGSHLRHLHPALSACIRGGAVLQRCLF